MNDRLGLYIQAQIFVAHGWKWRNVALIAKDLRNLRRIEDGRITGIQDREALAKVKGRVRALAGAHGQVLQAADPRLIDGQGGSKLIQAQSHEREPAPKRCKGLFEN